MKTKQQQMTLFGKNTDFLVSGKFVDPLSAGLNHDLSAGQKVTSMNVPLVSFGNPVIDDLQRDLYWSMFLAKDNLTKTPPEGREVVRGMLEWVLSDPTYKTKTMMLVNHKVSAASASYVMVENLMNMPQVKSGLSGMGQAEQMENQADDLDEQANNPQEPQDEQGEDENDNPPQDLNDGEDEASQGMPQQEVDQLYQPSPDELREQAQELRQQAAQMRAKAEQAMQDAMQAKMNEFGRSGAIDAGTGYGEEVAGFLASWGVDEGKGLMLSPDQIMSIMRSLNSAGVGMLTALIGRVYGIASNTLRGRSQAKIIVDEGGMTQDIQAMHPAERYKLTQHYRYRAQAIDDWLSRGLGGVTKSMQATREGNFICFVDESGSMSCDTKDGTREEIAKALALGLSKAAIDNGQQIVLAGFGNDDEITKLVTNNTPLDERLEWAQFMFDGGPLRLDQRIATPNGWKPIGDARVGDYVFGVDGNPVKVIGVYPQGTLDLKRVRFSDGAEVVCDLSHLWTVTDSSSLHKVSKTMRLDEIQKAGLRYGESNWRFRIPVALAIELPEKELPLHPYFLGTLLGDGSFVGGSPNIASAENEFPWAEVLPDGVSVSDNWEKREGMCPVFGLVSGNRGGHHSNPVTDALRSLNLWKVSAQDKFIPDEYLWASVEQRWGLLQGICDTDGCAKKQGGVEVSTISKDLAFGIIQLVQSLGGLATVQSKKRKDNEQLLFRVSIQLDGERALFRLSRKADSWKPRKRPITRSIVSIQDESPDEAICIKIDREDGLFLTEGMVVTHNTDFDSALKSMMDILEQYDESDRLKTDLMMITDGDCPVSPHTEDRLLWMKETYGVRLFVLLIDDSGRTSQIEDVADVVMKFTGLDDIAEKLANLIWQEV